MEDKEKEVVVVETPKPKEPSQDKPKERTRLEKLRYTRANIDSQIAEEEKANGIVISDEEDDDRPLTKRDLKNIERENAKKSALQMADELPEDERASVRELLETRIVPSGNPQKDYRDAVALANSDKNGQVVAEVKRTRDTKVTRPASGGAPRKEEPEFVASEVELRAASMVGKKTPEDIKVFILKARAREAK